MAEAAATRFAASPVWLRWTALVVGSAVLAGTLTTLHVSAALLLGAIFAAVVLAAAGAPVSVPQPAFFAAQALIGAMIARAFTPGLFVEFAHRWPLFLAAIASVLIAAAAIGWLLTRFRVLPGTTAAWGTFPGAATVMVLMAGEFGADMRLVAFMQYSRVLLVALAATVVAHAFDIKGGAAAAAAPPLHIGALVATLLVAAAAALAALRLKIPAGPLIGPMVACTALQLSGLLSIELPRPLLALAYAVAGWAIGLRFTREILIHVLRALPRVLASIAILIAVCGAFAAALVAFAGLDPLTAYLAMSPGGADSIAIIAAASPHVDVSFVMALQVSRFLAIMAFGPSLARLVARSAARDA
ncbi:putative regulator AbrB [Beijerinckiaceae bacterium RH AL1]|nr:AbrB family transcriptional regulator [Beijerinckiaceae bacterium]VVB49036.1 putative regulator AbrB [Beijerinckiaceae bacterium RH CH11]VVB49115.1 putative regulator AbrB [Beijerinckiaceae bacterium RH AL8]VVC56695.1 putative regulator AbrB [Beijerinckiaceae bacterium RH AL1]